MFRGKDSSYRVDFEWESRRVFVYVYWVFLWWSGDRLLYSNSNWYFETEKVWQSHKRCTDFENEAIINFYFSRNIQYYWLAIFIIALCPHPLVGYFVVWVDLEALMEGEKNFRCENVYIRQIGILQKAVLWLRDKSSPKMVEYTYS